MKCEFALINSNIREIFRVDVSFTKGVIERI